jgi:carbon storage regulator
MLVLSRREGEQIVIANDIVITVTRVGKQRVQLGIRAPGSVHVRRAELPLHPQHAEPVAVGAGMEFAE